MSLGRYLEASIMHPILKELYEEKSLPLFISKKTSFFKNIKYEIVERKGVGHPDSLCDGISEAVCHRLCKYYLKKYGFVLPHHLNKVMIIGGGATPTFGGGKVNNPMKVFLGGSAVDKIIDRNGNYYDENIFEIAKESASKYMESILPFLSINEHVRFENYIKGIKRAKVRGKPFDLRKIDKNLKFSTISEDTTICVGYAPFSPTEKLTLEIEQHLNSKEFKRTYPEIGTEIKIMSARIIDDLYIIAVCGMISSLIKNKNHYKEMKELVKEEIHNIVQKYDFSDVNIEINVNDKINYKLSLTTRVGLWGGGGKPYLLVTGTHAERGKGQTGRGNRVHGLITPMRPMSIEAAAGKPPWHPGKLYGLMAFDIANKLLSISGLEETEVYILSQGGKSLTQPKGITVFYSGNEDISEVKDDIYDLIEKEFEFNPIYEKIESMINHPPKVF